MRRDRRPKVIIRLGKRQGIPGRLLAEARGFTAMELVLAASVSLIILTAIYTALVSTRGTYDAGESRADIQQQGRFATEMLTRELRLIGNGFPAPENPPLPDCDGDATGDNAVLAATPTSVTFCADVRNASTTLVSDAIIGDTSLDVDDVSGIVKDDLIFLMAGGTWEQVDAKNVKPDKTPNELKIDGGAGPGGGIANDYSQGILVGSPKAITYCWNDANGAPGAPTCGPDASTLYKAEAFLGGGKGKGVLNFDLLADGIQALQLQYFDGSDLEILPANLAANLTNIRRIRVTITLQSAQGSLGTQNFTMTSNVRLRNL